MECVTDNCYIIRETISGTREIPAYLTKDFGAIPQIVYKYLDISKSYNRDSLIEDYLWFSDPTTFNDPFDCKVSFAYHLLAEDEVKCREYYRFIIDMNYSNLSIVQKENLIERNVNMMLSKRSDTDFFRKREKEMALDISVGLKDFGILCTCMINDNILLWSHYAASHRDMFGVKSGQIIT